MSSALYRGEVLSIDGPVLRYRLTIAHQDVSEFGSGPTFGWRLLADWVSPEGEVAAEESVNVKRFIKSVTLGEVESGAVTSKMKFQLAVRRTSEAAEPSVVYTIEVTDPRLLTGVQVGDRADVYADSSPPQPAARKPARKPAARPAAAPTKQTFADFRRVALEIIRSWRERTQSPSEALIDSGQLLDWSRDATDAQVQEWIGCLHQPNQVRAAALVALQRLRAGQAAAAQDFLRLAESSFVAPPPESGPWEPSARAGERSLIPMWWCCGETEKAAAAFAPWREYGLTHDCHGAGKTTLFSITAEGRRYELAREFFPGALLSGREHDRLAAGLLAILEDGEAGVFEELMTVAANISDGKDVDYYLNFRLLKHLWHDPARYLAHLLAWPNVLRPHIYGPVALRQLELTNPAQAVEVAAQILATPGKVRDYLELEAVAVLGTHAPDRGAEWASTGLTTSANAHRYPSGYLAALGRNAEARLAPDWYTPIYTCDHTLASEGLKQRVTASTSLCGPRELVPLVDLGERTFVDAYLESTLAELAQRPASKRDLDCRRFAQSAAVVGRPDLAFASIKLPTPKLREYTASDLVVAAASVGDFTTALGALELVSTERKPDAVREALAGVQRAFAEGPRAVPLRVVSDAYAQSLAAAASVAPDPFLAPAV